MNFPESVLITAYYISFVFLDISVVCDFILSHFRFLSTSIFFFCWSSKKPWDRSGGILVFKVVFLFNAFHKKKTYPFLIFNSIYLRVIMFESLMLGGLLNSLLSITPYSVREWCRFFTKLLRLLSKSDCFQQVLFGVPFSKTV